jgi:anti-anti-sigma regulatory factor
VWMTERRFANALILDIHGALAGTAACELLQMSVRTQVDGGAGLVIVNLSDVGVIDDHGVETIYAVTRSNRQRHIDLRIVGDPPRLAYAGAARLDASAIRMFATVDDALDDVRAGLEQRHERATKSRIRGWLAALRRRVMSER